MNKRFTPVLAVLLLSLLSLNGFAQRGAERIVTVESTVVDADGTPIAGAVISGREGAVEVLSDANGEFSIQVPENTNILIEARGYDQQVVTIYPDASTPPVRLERALYSPEQSDLVHIPFGQVMRKDLVGAVTVIDPKELASYDNTQSIAEAINGRVPGLLGTSNIRGRGNALIIVI